MSLAALATWIIAALVGGYLFATWIAYGGLRPRTGERASRFAPLLVLSHVALAVIGLAVWIGYLSLRSTALAWAALAVLALVAALGSTMFGLWLRGHGRSRGQHESGPRHAAEDHFPPPAVLTHGAFAVTTVVLVLVTALRAV
jgi:manganese efflux pump family protein